MNSPVFCPTHRRELVEGKPFKTRKQFACPEEDCDVVCWEGRTSTPADKNTRTKRSWCHAAFDPLWKNKTPFKNRYKAYVWLSRKMGISKDACHFGMFSAEQCLRALELIDQLKASLKGAE